ncbi:MAG TPA: response regulator [Stellaceae bacterium]|nr:response regulator [Stellaceae bacterium]
MGKRVLVVDDSVAIGRLVKTYLEREGHAVTAVTSAMAALAAAETGERIDVFILDVHMHAGDPHGVSLAKMLAQRHPDTAIVFITGDSRLAAGPELAGRPVFPKPLDFAALCKAVAGDRTAP